MVVGFRLAFVVTLALATGTLTCARSPRKAVWSWINTKLNIREASENCSVEGKPVNWHLGWESSLHVSVLVLFRLYALRAVWLVWSQQEQDMSALNLHLSWQGLSRALTYEQNVVLRYALEEEVREKRRVLIAPPRVFAHFASSCSWNILCWTNKRGERLIQHCPSVGRVG